MPLRAAAAFAAALALAATAAARAAEPFSAATGAPDGRVAVAAGPGAAAADDVLLARGTSLTSMSVTGLLPSAAPLSTIASVAVEAYRVFPAGSDAGRTIQVPSRANSPADLPAEVRDSASGGATVGATLLSGSFTALNSVVTGIHPLPAQTTGGDGAVSGEEVRVDLTLTPPLHLDAGRWFLSPQVTLSSGRFLWLSTARAADAGDLAVWVRDGALAPDWLRVGTDVIGGATPPAFDASFALQGTLDCPAIGVLLGQASAAGTGAPVSARLFGDGGTPPYVFSSTSAPAGLSVAPDGTISGTPVTTGQLSVPVTVTDAHGCHGTGAPVLFVQPPMSVPARLSGLRIQPSAFRVAHRRAGGAQVRFTLDQAARVTLTVQRLRRHRSPATVSVSVALAGHAGLNRVRFAGRIGGHALAPGRYRLVATPADGTPRRAGFRILR